MKDQRDDSGCHQFKTLLSAYCDAYLSSPEVDRIEAHLASCKRCSSEVDFIQRLSHVLNEAEAVDPPADLRLSILKRTVFNERPVSPALRWGWRKLLPLAFAGSAIAASLLLIQFLQQPQKTLQNPAADHRIASVKTGRSASSLQPHRSTPILSIPAIAPNVIAARPSLQVKLANGEIIPKPVYTATTSHPVKVPPSVVSSQSKWVNVGQTPGGNDSSLQSASAIPIINNDEPSKPAPAASSEKSPAPAIVAQAPSNITAQRAALTIPAKMESDRIIVANANLPPNSAPLATLADLKRTIKNRNDELMRQLSAFHFDRHEGKIDIIKTNF